MKNILENAMCTYLSTGKGLETLKRLIAVKAYSYPLYKEYCGEEDCAEFLLSFYPRIANLVRHYKNQGAPFDKYLQICLDWHMKSFLKFRLRRKRQERVLYRETGESLQAPPDEFWEVAESEPPYNGKTGEESWPHVFASDKKRGTFLRQFPRTRRQIILLTLKCAAYIDDQNIENISALTGLHSTIVFHLVEVLRTIMRRRTERVKKLMDKRRRNYLRIRYLLEEKENCTDDFTSSEIDKKIRKERRCYRNTDKRLSRAPLSPSHKDIARILGMSKGTVDSGFYYLKKNFFRTDT
ncbi:MAG: hypothetical protein LBC67_06885 [Spirochaetales bacterium]|jgi:hypothetical protein|nr:hypothetical protein [Spirochaetales bacterium]